MKKFIAILMVVLMFACITDNVFAQKAPVGKTSDSEITQTKATKEKVKKEKVKKEKVKKEKVKKEKTKKEKVKKEKPQKDAVKQDKASKQKAVNEPVSNYQRVNKRSALSMFLNPNLDIQEIRASHILVKKRKDAVRIRKEILNGDITFEDAAREYSLCPTSARGGDLGYFNRKRMDQIFSDTAFDLKIGEISDPVGTKFGWHIIKVYDKR